MKQWAKHLQALTGCESRISGCHQFNSTFKELGVQQTLLEQNPQDSKDTKQPPYIPYKSNGLMFPAQVQ